MRVVGPTSLRFIDTSPVASQSTVPAQARVLTRAPANDRRMGLVRSDAVEQAPPAKGPRLDPVTARIVETTQALIRVPSQGRIDDPRPICEAVLSALATAGLRGEMLVRDGKPVGVVAEVTGAHAGPTYVLNSVIDTAPVGDASLWSAKPFSAELRNNRLLGRGVGDSKVAAALFIEVGARLSAKADAMHGRALLFFDAAEHTGHFEGMRTFVEQHCSPRPAGMLIGYPGNESLQIGSRGFMRRHWRMELPRAGALANVVQALAAPFAVALPEERRIEFPLTPKLTPTAVTTTAHGAPVSVPGTVFEVDVIGRSAHSGASATAGTNALVKSGAFLEELSAQGLTLFGDSFAPIVLDLEGGKEFSQVPDSIRVRVLIPQSSATPAQAQHMVERALRATDDATPGIKASAIASTRPAATEHPLSELELNIDMRTTPAFDADDAQAHLDRCAARVASAGVRSSATDRESWPAYKLQPGSPMQNAMMTAIADAGLGKVQPRIAGPSNAGNVAAAFNIPATAGFGVSCKRAHGTDESIDVGTIPAALRVYTEAMQKLFGIPTSV